MFERVSADWDLRNKKGLTLLHIVERHNIEKAIERFNYLMNKKISS